MAPLGLVAEPDEDLVEVCVVALSGQDIIKFKVPRNTHAEDLYDMAGGSFASGICFKLSFQDQVLERNVDQPFRTATSPAVLNFTAGWHSRASAKSLLVDGGGLINLVRRGRHKLAHGILVNSSEDLMKPELLSWVAYTSGGAGPGTRPNGCPAPGALRLLWHVIKQRPGQARCRDPDTGKLPLHDAAWGHAPPEVAILLAACFPAGLKDRRNRSLESPEDLGRYVHSNFSWPSTDQLEARAKRVRAAGQLFSKLQRLMNQKKQVGLQGCLAGLNLGPRAAFAVASFLSDSEELIHFGLTIRTLQQLCGPTAIPSTRDGKLKPADEAVAPANFMQLHQPAVSRRGRTVLDKLVPDTPTQDTQRRRDASPTGIQHLREHFLRDNGVYGGACRVRNRRCSFVEVSEVQVGEKRFKLETHVSRTVHSSIQRKPSPKPWPDRKSVV